MQQANVQGEPWMRGTHPELDPLRRAVIHALELAEEDAARWAAPLGSSGIFARPHGLPSVALHLRHIARSLDRLLTYAEGGALNQEQLGSLANENVPGNREEVMREFKEGISMAKMRIRAFDPSTYDQPRGIGRKQLPTTVAGLLIHCAEHTQRHSGQMVTTAKLTQASDAEGAGA
ncbi:MAG: DinB family protein [Janthinobacterium lividum]